MTNEEIIEKIRTTLAEEFEIDVELIQPDAPLMQTLELDWFRVHESYSGDLSERVSYDQGVWWAFRYLLSRLS